MTPAYPSNGVREGSTGPCREASRTPSPEVAENSDREPLTRPPPDTTTVDQMHAREGSTSTCRNSSGTTSGQTT
ncbi:unnamed protein product [Ectocarpus sp. 6 AP-2014]